MFLFCFLLLLFDSAHWHVHTFVNASNQRLNQKSVYNVLLLCIVFYILEQFLHFFFLVSFYFYFHSLYFLSHINDTIRSKRQSQCVSAWAFQLFNSFRHECCVLFVFLFFLFFLIFFFGFCILFIYYFRRVSSFFPSFTSSYLVEWVGSFTHRQRMRFIELNSWLQVIHGEQNELDKWRWWWKIEKKKIHWTEFYCTTDGFGWQIYTKYTHLIYYFVFIFAFNVFLHSKLKFIYASKSVK